MDQNMTDAAMWALIVGFLSPLVIAVVQRPEWKDWARALVTFVYCLIAGAVTAYLNGAMEGRSLVSTILLVFVVAIAAYRGLWKDVGAPQIEAATSPRHLLVQQAHPRE